MNNLPALRAAHNDDIDFDGDLAILGLLRAKLFRQAIATDTQLPDMPNISRDLETQIATTLRELDTTTTPMP
jgi:hypothetical protein